MKSNLQHPESFKHSKTNVTQTCRIISVNWVKTVFTFMKPVASKCETKTGVSCLTAPVLSDTDDVHHFPLQHQIKNE